MVAYASASAMAGQTRTIAGIALLLTRGAAIRIPLENKEFPKFLSGA